MFYDVETNILNNFMHYIQYVTIKWILLNLLPNYVCTIPILPKSSNIHGMLFRWNAKHIWTAFWDTFQSAMLFRKQPSRFSKSHNGQHCVVNTVFTPLLDFQIDFLSVFWDWWLLNRCIVTFFGWAQVRYVLLSSA